MDRRFPTVRGLSFVDDVTWIAVGSSVREVSGQLERVARSAIGYNAVSFEASKTEAILL